MKTLEEAKQELRDNWKESLDCPCCGRWVRLNPYTFHHSVAVCLIELYKATVNGEADEDNFLHVENYLVKIGSNIKGVIGKAKYWGLVESMPNDDPKKKTSGFWRITQKGIDFLRHDLQIPKTAFVFDDKSYKFSDETIGIREALGELFNYTEMMGGALEKPEPNQTRLI